MNEARWNSLAGERDEGRVGGDAVERLAADGFEGIAKSKVDPGHVIESGIEPSPRESSRIDVGRNDPFSVARHEQRHRPSAAPDVERARALEGNNGLNEVERGTAHRRNGARPARRRIAEAGDVTGKRHVRRRDQARGRLLHDPEFPQRGKVAEHGRRLLRRHRVVEDEKPQCYARRLHRPPHVPDAHGSPKSVVHPIAHTRQAGDKRPNSQRVQSFGEAAQGRGTRRREAVDVERAHGEKVGYRRAVEMGVASVELNCRSRPKPDAALFGTRQRRDAPLRSVLFPFRCSMWHACCVSILVIAASPLKGAPATRLDDLVTGSPRRALEGVTHATRRPPSLAHRTRL